MANIRINSLPPTTAVMSDDVLPMDGATTRKIRPSDMLNAIRPISTQGQAEAGTDNATSMSPLATFQAIDAKLPNTASGRAMLTAANPAAQRTLLGLGGAALLSTGTTAGTVAAGDDSRITGAAQKSANLSDLANASTARTNLGLGNSATRNVGTTAGTVAAGDDIRFAGVAAIVDQATAQAGSDNSGIMSPLRTSQFVGFNLGITRSEIATRYIPVNAFYVSGESAEGDLGAGALYVTGTSGGPRAVQDASGAWFELSCPVLVNVGWFGAKGDGTGDDQPAIQAAIDRATALSRPCYMPPGLYQIGSKLTLQKTANVRFYGAGRYLTQIKGEVGYSDYYIDHGSGDATGGSLSTIDSMGFTSPVLGAVTASGINAQNCNATTYQGLHFFEMSVGLALYESFAVHVIDCTCVRGNYFVYATTKAHNLVVDRCRVYGVVNQAVRIDNDTDGITITNSDVEYCGSVLQASTGGGIVVTGVLIYNTYIEGIKNNEFVFDNCRGFWLNSCFVGMAGATAGPPPEGGPDTADLIPRVWNNINGGQVQGCSMYKQYVNWGSNVDGLDVFPPHIYDTEAAMQAPPWKTPSFLNSWAAGARAPGYRKNSVGEVLMRGAITGGTAGAPAFQLPAGYRPAQQRRFLQAGNAAVPVLLIADTNGNVAPTPASGPECNLDGVCYIAA